MTITTTTRSFAIAENRATLSVAVSLLQQTEPSITVLNTRIIIHAFITRQGRLENVESEASIVCTVPGCIAVPIVRDEFRLHSVRFGVSTAGPLRVPRRQ